MYKQRQLLVIKEDTVARLKEFLKTAAPYLLFVFIGYCIADLVIMNFRDLMVPSQAPPSRPRKFITNNVSPKNALNSIVTKNIFNWDGKVPDPILPKGQKPGEEEDPVPSSLPLNLVGTIVHSNPKKSIANIEIRGKNNVLPFSPEMDIDGMAVMHKVERGKAIFRNNNNQRLEFIEMKTQGAKLSFGSALPSAASAGGGGGEVVQTAPNQYEVKRADIKKYTANLAQVLQQAAMAPRRNAAGEIECFKFLSIQPGSVYTQLGFQNGDCLTSVNGQKIDSPSQAMQMYQEFQNANQIKLSYERDGRQVDSTYNVK